MMKWVWMMGLCFVLWAVAAEDEEIGAHEALGLMFLQIGTEAFLSDFDEQQLKTEKHDAEIAEIKRSIEEIRANVAFLAKQLQDSRYQVSAEADNAAAATEMPTAPASPGQSVKLEKLEREMGQIRTLLTHLLEQKPSDDGNSLPPASKIAPQSTASSADTEEIIALQVGTQTAAVYNRPRIDSKVIVKLDRGAIVKTESCNRYGWCRLESGGYIERYRFITP